MMHLEHSRSQAIIVARDLDFEVAHAELSAWCNLLADAVLGPPFCMLEEEEDEEEEELETIRRNVKPDTMLRLKTAAALAFPDGSMSAAGLRREAEAGRLTIYRIANKHFTTLTDIQEMKDKCRVQAKGQGSISPRRKGTDDGSGSSGTVNKTSALDAFKATAQKLRKNLRPTSPASTTQKPHSATVTPIKSK
jgi:hypothetical protein